MSLNVKVFIDAENVSPTEYKNKYEKKISRILKENKLSPNSVEYRAYLVENAPQARNWYIYNVKDILIPGKPAKDKVDKYIMNEMCDKANGNNICLLVTKDKLFQNKVKKKLDNIIFP